MMKDLAGNLDRLLEIIETNLKRILWNGNNKPSIDWLGDYQITVIANKDEIAIRIKPRRGK